MCVQNSRRFSHLMLRHPLPKTRIHQSLRLRLLVLLLSGDTLLLGAKLILMWLSAATGTSFLVATAGGVMGRCRVSGRRRRRRRFSTGRTCPDRPLLLLLLLLGRRRSREDSSLLIWLVLLLKGVLVDVLLGATVGYLFG